MNPSQYLDAIIRRAIPDDPKDCRIKKDAKVLLRLNIKQDLLVFISRYFAPKPDGAYKDDK